MGEVLARQGKENPGVITTRSGLNPDHAIYYLWDLEQGICFCGPTSPHLFTEAPGT